MDQLTLTAQNAVNALEGSEGSLVLTFDHGDLTEEVRYNAATNQFEHIILSESKVNEYEQMNHSLAECLLSDKLEADSMDFEFSKYSDSKFTSVTSYPEDTFTRN